MRRYKIPYHLNSFDEFEPKYLAGLTWSTVEDLRPAEDAGIFIVEADDVAHDMLKSKPDVTFIEA